jgi:hypothetical protein
MACAHNLAHLPPWKSLSTLRQMSGLVADKDVYQAEVYGVLLSGGATYLPRSLLDAATSRKRVTEFSHASIVWIAIDPPAHKVSDMGMTAFILNSNGLHVIIGLGNINLARAMTTEVQLCVHQFLTRIRKHPAVGAYTVICPILECECEWRKRGTTWGLYHTRCFSLVCLRTHMAFRRQQQRGPGHVAAVHF